MKFKDFAEAVARTENPGLTAEQKASNWALGIAGESGEVVELIKKHLYHGKPLDLCDLEKELGDVLYYVQAMCNLFGLEFEGCMDFNVLKLQERYPNGFVEGGGVRNA